MPPPRPSLPSQINNPGELFRASHPFSLVTGLLLILCPVPVRPSPPRQSPPGFFFPSSGGGDGWAGAEGEGKSAADGAGEGSPPRAPRALAFLSLKHCVHKGLASAFQLGNRDLFTFTLSPVPTRL